MGAVFSSAVEGLPPLRDFILPTPETYVILINIFQYFPLFSIAQWLTSFHPAGKTSLKRSSLNIPGRLGWFAMEIVGPINLVFLLWKLPARLNITTLPLPNKLVASLYLLHYLNRAIISPFFSAPSMSPIHALVVSMAMLFNWLNSSCLAAWLVGYTRTTIPASTPIKTIPTTTPFLLPTLGLLLFFTGMLGNISAEHTLFRLRREEAHKRPSSTPKTPEVAPNSDTDTDKDTSKYAKVYVIPPPTGLFRSILYPHYVFEWLEWTGFALVGTAVPVFPAQIPKDGLGIDIGIGGGGGGYPPLLRLAPWLVPLAVLGQRVLGVSVLPLPALVFVVNAVANMLPHARWGRKWYLQSFGAEAVAGRGAVVPYCSWL